MCFSVSISVSGSEWLDERGRVGWRRGADDIRAFVLVERHSWTEWETDGTNLSNYQSTYLKQLTETQEGLVIIPFKTWLQ